jgi:hypothetical protein
MCRFCACGPCQLKRRKRFLLIDLSTTGVCMNWPGVLKTRAVPIRILAIDRYSKAYRAQPTTGRAAAWAASVRPSWWLARPAGAASARWQGEQLLLVPVGVHERMELVNEVLPSRSATHSMPVTRVICHQADTIYLLVVLA